ncbi:uncharacterized protein N7482_000230 [Penicillium canariense]|uniref:DASH complex subunit DAM1 n=1 Tax=Penicillium canariense TaxID=189055 RepID=A0A9W9IB15_9EURO|nr:uncharacterized protein N7482_000230 [Penicillium canariense]KAJ5174353.1 hypothetical protein N7482_000230 [Penicillium canariense]
MDAVAPRSSSRPRPSSRPTTPLRPSSRSSLREAHGYGHNISHVGYNQPAINALEPQFAELADSMADLEANFMHLQLMHESLTRFSESFASFLYGMNMNAFCVDFPEAPMADSFKRAKQAAAQKGMERTSCSIWLGFSDGGGSLIARAEAENEPARPDDGEMTFLRAPLPATLLLLIDFPPRTTDTSFVEHPPSTVSSKPTSKYPASTRGTTRGGATRGDPSGLPPSKLVGTTLVARDYEPALGRMRAALGDE